MTLGLTSDQSDHGRNMRSFPGLHPVLAVRPGLDTNLAAVYVHERTSVHPNPNPEAVARVWPIHRSVPPARCLPGLLMA